MGVLKNTSIIFLGGGYQGNMLLTKPVSQLGNGSITISASELQPGMYIYTLAVDGQEADSKRMIITEE